MPSCRSSCRRSPLTAVPDPRSPARGQRRRRRCCRPSRTDRAASSANASARLRAPGGPDQRLGPPDGRPPGPQHGDRGRLPRPGAAEQRGHAAGEQVRDGQGPRGGERGRRPGVQVQGRRPRHVDQSDGQRAAHSALGGDGTEARIALLSDRVVQSFRRTRHSRSQARPLARVVLCQAESGRQVVERGGRPVSGVGQLGHAASGHVRTDTEAEPDGRPQDDRRIRHRGRRNGREEISPQLLVVN